LRPRRRRWSRPRKDPGADRLHPQDDAGIARAGKYAVRAGGGGNHRFGLDDAILIKDNHIALAAISHRDRARQGAAGHLVKIEVEVDTLAQLEQALTLGVDAVLLDNMTVEELRQASQ